MAPATDTVRWLAAEGRRCGVLLRKCGRPGQGEGDIALFLEKQSDVQRFLGIEYEPYQLKAFEYGVRQGYAAADDDERASA